MVTMELFLLIIGVLLGTGAVNAQECSRENLRRCRASIIISMENQNSNDKLQLEEQCRTLRKNMDCVVEQTAMCLREDEQDSNSDIIWKTWRYLGSFCDQFGIWWSNPCFQREDLKRCETLLPNNIQSMDNVACRGYINFRDCATSIVNSKCSSEDQSLLVTYLVDRGQEKAWRCPKDPEMFLTRFESVPLETDPKETSKRYPMMMADFPSFSLGDLSCAPSLLTKDNQCTQKIHSDIADAKKEEDLAAQKRKICCASDQLNECVHDFIKEKCSEETAKKSQDISSHLLTLLGVKGECKDHTKDMCSGSLLRSISTLSLILTLISAIFVGRF